MTRFPNTTCKTCPNLFYARPSDKAKGNGKYCSHQCFLKDTYGVQALSYPFTRKCMVCPESFVISGPEMKAKSYCSTSCANVINNRKRKGSKYNRRTTMRRQLIERYGHRCMVAGCDYDKFINAHHIKERAKGGDNDVANGILLCPNHHAEVHGKILMLSQLLEFKSAADAAILEGGIRGDNGP